MHGYKDTNKREQCKTKSNFFILSSESIFDEVRDKEKSRNQMIPGFFESIVPMPGLHPRV